MEENKENKRFMKKWILDYCDSVRRVTNLEKEHVIVGVIIVFVIIISGISLFLTFKMDDVDLALEKVGEMSEQEIYEEVKSIQETINTSNWKVYQSQWYGFSLKYPDGFNLPVVRRAPIASNWEYRYEFRKTETGDSPFSGFDLVIYNVKKTKELAKIDEFPTIKNEWLKNDPWCQTILGRIIETGDYPAEEIYISPTDSCYNPTLFFTFTRDEYIFVLIPAVKEGNKISGDPRIEINDHFPEFLGIISTAELISIKRSKPSTTVKISAPKPVSYKTANGLKVCAKKNDHPGKSKQDKGRHLDMECCLDPDEYPNPHCYYPASKYGKYL